MLSNENKKKKQWITKRLHEYEQPNSKTEYVYFGLMFDQKENSLLKFVVSCKSSFLVCSKMF